jgi:hypothetical protein
LKSGIRCFMTALQKFSVLSNLLARGLAETYRSGRLLS